LIIVDDSKLVDRLAGSRAVPVEVVSFGWRQTARWLEQLGCTPELRQREGEPFVSDEGHFILDCAFPPLSRPAETARAIKQVIGVVDHGLFIDLADLVIVGGEDGIRCFEAERRFDAAS
jgi:ribose 5-phosphate isomerase A